MGTVNKSSSDSGTGVDSNQPLNRNRRRSFDVAFGSEAWNVFVSGTYPWRPPFSVLCAPSHVSVVVQDFDPYDAER